MKACFERLLWKEANLLVIRGESTPLLGGMLGYQSSHEVVGLYEGEEPKAAEILMSMALAAASQPEDEQWGWSFTLAGSANGYFCGVEDNGLIALSRREAERNRALVVVQRHRRGRDRKDSQFETQASNAPELVRDYFARSIQLPTRVAIDGAKGVLVQALPGGKLKALHELGDAALISKIDELQSRNVLQVLDTRSFGYGCRCSDEWILQMLTSLDPERRAELWGDLRQLEIQCPRCSREFHVSRAAAVN